MISSVMDDPGGGAFAIGIESGPACVCTIAWPVCVVLVTMPVSVWPKESGVDERSGSGGVVVPVTDGWIVTIRTGICVPAECVFCKLP